MINKSNTRLKSMVFFWPRNTLENVHMKKDPGAIPLGFIKLGYKVTLIVDKFNANNIPKIINVIELDRNKLHPSKRREKSNLTKPILSYDPLINFFYIISESITSAKIFNKITPSIVITLHTNMSSILSLSLYRFIKTLKIWEIKKRSEPNINKYLLKLDINPDVIKEIYNNKGIRKLISYLLIFLPFLLYDKILVETTCAYNELSKLKISTKLLKKLEIVPDGYSDQNIQIRKRQRKNIILSVGVISYVKGFDILLRSFQKVYQYHIDWQLRIVGPINDASYYAKLKKMITTFGLENSVVFTGGLYGEKLEEEFNKASIFCFLSRSESFGIVRAEAIAHGLPLITSQAGCGIEYEKYGSLIVPVDDVEKSAEEMLKLIENPEIRDQISKKQINAIMTWDQVAKKIDEISRQE